MSLEQWIVFAVTTLLTGIGAIWGVLKYVAPRLIDSKIEERQVQLTAQIEEARDKREHTQDIEDMSLSALAQHNVTVTSQLVALNQVLVKELLAEHHKRMDSLEQKMSLLHQVALRDEAQLTIIKMEWTKISDSLVRLEGTMNLILGVLKGDNYREADKTVVLERD